MLRYWHNNILSVLMIAVGSYCDMFPVHWNLSACFISFSFPVVVVFLVVVDRQCSCFMLAGRLGCWKKVEGGGLFAAHIVVKGLIEIDRGLKNKLWEVSRKIWYIGWNKDLWNWNPALSLIVLPSAWIESKYCCILWFAHGTKPISYDHSVTSQDSWELPITSYEKKHCAIPTRMFLSWSIYVGF